MLFHSFLYISCNLITIEIRLPIGLTINGTLSTEHTYIDNSIAHCTLDVCMKYENERFMCVIESHFLWIVKIENAINSLSSMKAKTCSIIIIIIFFLWLLLLLLPLLLFDFLYSSSGKMI